MDYILLITRSDSIFTNCTFFKNYIDVEFCWFFFWNCLCCGLPRLNLNLLKNFPRACTPIICLLFLELYSTIIKALPPQHWQHSQHLFSNLCPPIPSKLALQLSLLVSSQAPCFARKRLPRPPNPFSLCCHQNLLLCSIESILHEGVLLLPRSRMCISIPGEEWDYQCFGASPQISFSWLVWYWLAVWQGTQGSGCQGSWTGSELWTRGRDSGKSD